MSTTFATFTDSDGIEWNVEKYLSRVCIERWVNGEREIRLSLNTSTQVEALILGLELVEKRLPETSIRQEA